jgi:hypothetical protein
VPSGRAFSFRPPRNLENIAAVGTKDRVNFYKADHKLPNCTEHYHFPGLAWF